MRTPIITGLAAVALVLTGCSSGAEKPAGGGSASAPSEGAATAGGQAASGEVAVAIKDFLFVDKTVTVTPGTKITWTNRESAIHSVVSTEKGVFASQDAMEENATFSFTPTKSGTIDYICGIHNYMKGTIVVS
ncbi:MAG TPA: cupredoxin domain-containing protein [Mycobacteriales bacterium]|nr:cupredoxin domain-containing protein [Mycobacteriales bacterium]